MNYSLFSNRARNENKLTLNGQTSTGQHTSQLIHPAMNEPLSTRQHRNQQACIDRGCLCLRDLFMIGT